MQIAPPFERWSHQDFIFERAAESRVVDIEHFMAANYSDLRSLNQGKTPAEAAGDYVRDDNLPPGGMAERSYPWLLVRRPGDSIVGLFHLYKGYPREASWYIGLLIIDHRLRRRGVGSRLVRGIAAVGFRERVTDLRAAVDLLNVEALCFWHSQGFNRIERIAPKETGYTLMELSCPLPLDILPSQSSEDS